MVVKRKNIPGVTISKNEGFCKDFCSVFCSVKFKAGCP